VTRADGYDPRVAASGLDASLEKMRDAGVPEIAQENFRFYYEQLVAGESGVVSEDDIEPADDVPDAASLAADEASEAEALGHAVVIKLNGGLGTSMTRAKSLLPVKDGLSFLDVTVRQVLSLRERHGVRLPLVLMNSFSTREDSLAALEAHPDLASDVPADFGQNQEPKLLAEDLTPVEWPEDPRLEWCPPGHGDVYTALVSSGMLESLLERGYRYAFIANADNLGAVLDPKILGWFAREEMPFLMEVADRTEADRKGGHICREKSSGRLLLRESAQTRDEDQDAFQDVARHRYFNTNNLWVNLETLRTVMDSRGGVLGLPMIRNGKTVDPSDSSSPAVIQIETAMGAAISVFDGARAVRVGRERFAPVKTTNDLLVLRSDVYELTEEAHVVVSSRRAEGDVPFVDLDSKYFKLLPEFDERFASGPPSLVECERLVVRGDVAFGAGVVAKGVVDLVNDGDEQMIVSDGSVLS
jgi:UTP--glucose-1-phosphate uridylyltransferase